MGKKFKALCFTPVQVRVKAVLAHMYGLPWLLRSLAMTLRNGLFQAYGFCLQAANVKKALTHMYGLPRLLRSLAMTLRSGLFQLYGFLHLSANIKEMLAHVYRLPRLLRNLAMTLRGGLSRSYELHTNSLSVIPAKAGIQVSKIPMLRFFLFVLLAMPGGCSCFPDHSKEIEKEREWDTEAKKMDKAYWLACENYKTELPKAKARIQHLNQSSPDITKKQQLKTECIDFLQGFYLPYLSAWQPYEAHGAKHERDRSKKAKTEELARKIASHMRYIKEDLLHENDTSKLCKFILELKE